MMMKIMTMRREVEVVEEEGVEEVEEGETNLSGNTSTRRERWGVRRLPWIKTLQ